MSGIITGIVTGVHTSLESTSGVNKLSWLGCAIIDMVQTVQQVSSKDSYLGKYFFKVVGRSPFAEKLSSNLLQPLAIGTNVFNLIDSLNGWIKPPKGSRLAVAVMGAPNASLGAGVSGAGGVPPPPGNNGRSLIETLRKASFTAYNIFSLAGHMHNLNLVFLGRFLKPVRIITNITLLVGCVLDADRAVKDGEIEKQELEKDRKISSEDRKAEKDKIQVKTYLEVASNVCFAVWVVFSQAIPYYIATAAIAPLSAGWILLPPALMLTALATDWIQYRMSYESRKELEARAESR